MTENEQRFLDQSVGLLEDFLLGLPLGSLFTGELYTGTDQRLPGLMLEGFTPDPIWLSPVEVGRLFMAPDLSIVDASNVPEGKDGTPAGVQLKSDNDFVQEDDPVIVVAYQDEDGPGVQLQSLHLVRVMLNEGAPQRFCTVAFGLMACTAYRLGFTKITLFAGGNGPPPDELEEGDLVGYMVWPKFGFDAELSAADVNSAPQHLRTCRSVRALVDIDSEWWEEHGRGREMRFDLSPDSRSWRVLINYLYEVLSEDAE
jgi:hypothetical protein